MQDGKECGSGTQQLLLNKLQESNHATSNQRQRAQPTTVSHSLTPIIFMLCDASYFLCVVIP